MENKRRKRRRNKRLGFSIIIRLLGFIVICCAIFFAMTVFFKIQKITIVGESPYTDEYIIEASGISIGENTFFVNKFAAIAKIFAKCPYIDQITMRRHLPSTLEISVTKCEGIAMFEFGGENYIIDINGKILGKKEEGDETKYIEILNGEPQSGEIGKYINFLQKEKEKTLLNILPVLKKYDIIKETKNIDLAKLYNLTFAYKERFVVAIGSGEKIEEKIKLLLAVEEKLGPAERGTIDISDTEYVFVQNK